MQRDSEFDPFNRDHVRRFQEEDAALAATLKVAPILENETTFVAVRRGENTHRAESAQK